MRVLAAGVAAAALFAAPAHAAEPYDFDADGQQELVVGIGGTAFMVLRTDERGLVAARGSLPLARRAVSGDFDGDGRADLAALGGSSDIAVYHGSADGLAEDRSVTMDEGTGTVVTELATGDMDRDGFADLVVAERRDVETVTVAWGGPDGLAASRTTVAASEAEQLELGDLDRDGAPELVYVRYDIRYTRVGVCRGDGRELRTCSETRHRGAIEDLAIADVTGGPAHEVVAGSTSASGGRVVVFRVRAGRLKRALSFDKSTKGVPGRARRGHAFGRALAAGDFDGDGKADLAIGDPFAAGGEGSVTIVHGARSGIAPRGNRRILAPDIAEPHDHVRRERFGADLALLDHDGNGTLDLDVAATDGRGEPGPRASVYYGNRRSFRGTRAETFGPDDLGIAPLTNERPEIWFGE
jgi:hypothetical protein